MPGLDVFVFFEGGKRKLELIYRQDEYQTLRKLSSKSTERGSSDPSKELLGALRQ